jgi:hypothetical protein
MQYILNTYLTEIKNHVSPEVKLTSNFMKTTRTPCRPLPGNTCVNPSINIGPPPSSSLFDDAISPGRGKGMGNPTDLKFELGLGEATVTVMWLWMRWPLWSG